MLRRPPRSTRPDTLFPYTTLFRSLLDGSIEAKTLIVHASARITGDVFYETITIENGGKVDGKLSHRPHGAPAAAVKAPPPLAVVEPKPSSDEPRVGQECVSTCISRWSP